MQGGSLPSHPPGAHHKDLAHDREMIARFFNEARAVGQSRLDCIRARDCTVVELEPDNEKGMKRGKEQVLRYIAKLNDDENERKKLATRNSDFKQCKEYDWEVWCYKLCPDIDPETGDMIKVEATWRKCVSK